MSGEWRRYENSRDGRTSKCAVCGQDIGPNEPRYWSKGQGLRCVSCHEASNDFKTTSPPAAGAKPPTIPTKFCQCCNRPSTNLIVQRLTDWSVIEICPDCDWLAFAQWKLKTLGLWRPTPKPEVKVE